MYVCMIYVVRVCVCAWVITHTFYKQLEGFILSLCTIYIVTCLVCVRKVSVLSFQYMNNPRKTTHIWCRDNTTLRRKKNRYITWILREITCKWMNPFAFYAFHAFYVFYVRWFIRATIFFCSISLCTYFAHAELMWRTQTWTVYISPQSCQWSHVVKKIHFLKKTMSNFKNKLCNKKNPFSSCE
jgi:hypothetical protein